MGQWNDMEMSSTAAAFVVVFFCWVDYFACVKVVLKPVAPGDYRSSTCYSSQAFPSLLHFHISRKKHR